MSKLVKLHFLNGDAFLINIDAIIRVYPKNTTIERDGELVSEKLTVVDLTKEGCYVAESVDEIGEVISKLTSE